MSSNWKQGALGMKERIKDLIAIAIVTALVLAALVSLVVGIATDPAPVIEMAIALVLAFAGVGALLALLWAVQRVGTIADRRAWW